MPIHIRFTFTCPKCSHQGSNDALKCHNCNGTIAQTPVSKNDFAHLTMECTRCGINQAPACPTGCGATITGKTTQVVVPPSSSTAFWVFVVIVAAVVFVLLQ